jgi:hypothetical protein
VHATLGPESGLQSTPHPDERGLQVRRERAQLPLSKLLLQQHLAVIAESYKVKGCLAKINANGMNLHVDDPP